MEMNRDDCNRAMILLKLARTDVRMLREEIAELRRTAERQAAEIAWLKRESARHERNQNLLCAYVQDEFARALLWLEAIGGKVLPKAATFANEFAAKFGQGRTVPPHQLGGRTEAKTE